MALDLDGRRLAKCALGKDCPFDAAVIDLTAGSFVTQGNDVYHAACYDVKTATKTERADVKAKRQADEALAAELAKARADRELAAAQAAYDAQVKAWQDANPGQPQPFGPRPTKAGPVSASVAEVTSARVDAPPAPRHAPAGDMPAPAVDTFATPGVPG